MSVRRREHTKVPVTVRSWFAGRAPAPSVSETLSERILLQTPILTVGEFRCRAGDPLWSRENVARGNLVVFPRVPVLIAQADREAVVADANRVMFYEAGKAYTRARISDAGDACEFFALQRVVAEEAVSTAGIAGVCRPGGLFPFAQGPSRARAYAAQRLIYEHAAGCTRPDVLAVEDVFLDVLMTVVRDAAADRGDGRSRRESTRRVHTEIAEIARSMLAADPASPISLSELAARVEVSPFHLCRVFRARVGMTISRYRDRLRLRASLERVAEQADLTAIAHDLGFCSHSHFTRAFGREFRMTPSSFRARVAAAGRRELVNLMTAV